MTVYCNNCQGKNHVGLHGQGAFFDLWATGSHTKKARNISAGQKCIVATPGKLDRNQITFSSFSFSHEAAGRYNGSPCRVLYGKRLKSDTLPKVLAAKTKPYSIFFNVKGHFNQWAVLER
jgi:hypothetical protein